MSLHLSVPWAGRSVSDPLSLPRAPLSSARSRAGRRWAAPPAHRPPYPPASRPAPRPAGAPPRLAPLGREAALPPGRKDVRGQPLLTARAGFFCSSGPCRLSIDSLPSASVPPRGRMTASGASSDSFRAVPEPSRPASVKLPCPFRPPLAASLAVWLSASARAGRSGGHLRPFVGPGWGSPGGRPISRLAGSKTAGGKAGERKHNKTALFLGREPGMAGSPAGGGLPAPVNGPRRRPTRPWLSVPCPPPEGGAAFTAYELSKAAGGPFRPAQQKNSLRGPHFS